MRTTVTLDADVQRLLKKAMRQREQSFKQLVNDSLRQTLGAKPGAAPAAYVPVTFSMGRPLVDLTKATALAAELEDLELAARSRHAS